VRILLVDPPAYSLPYDHELAEALARRGHDVELVTTPFAFGTPPEPTGYRRTELFAPLSGRRFRGAPRSRGRRALAAAEYAPSAVRLLRHARAASPDVVHVQWLPRPRLDLAWLRRLPRPLVYTAHNALPRNPRDVAARRETLRVVDRVVVHSRRAVGQAVELGVDPARVVAIPHGVLSPPVDAPPPAGRTLLFFGLIRPYKGLDVLVRAFRDVPDARLVVAGDPFGPVDRVQDERIEWRLGFVPEDEVPSLFAEATAVVLPYLDVPQVDSSGVLALALAYGRPLVVSDVGALGEVVGDFGAGLAVPAGDADALAAACREVLKHPLPFARGAEAAREAMSWDAAAEAHERLYLAAAGAGIVAPR
jgi:glycosyltransferase involved in cell wall biosynthesis